MRLHEILPESSVAHTMEPQREAAASCRMDIYAFQRKIMMLFADESLLMQGPAKHQLANQKYLPAKLE